MNIIEQIDKYLDINKEDENILMEFSIKDAIKNKISNLIINFVVSTYIKETEKELVKAEKDKEVSNKERYIMIISELEHKGYKGKDLKKIKSELVKRLGLKGLKGFKRLYYKD